MADVIRKLPADEFWTNNGFKLHRSKTKANQGRRVFHRGEISVLTPSKNNPWVTVQKTHGSMVDWFVDFTDEISFSNVLSFIDSFGSQKYIQVDL